MRSSRDNLHSPRQRLGRRRGSTLVYATFGTFALAAVSALAVDWGRVQVAKTELQAAADAAARYGVAGLQNSLSGASAARANASAVVAQNKADGRAINFVADEDVEIGVWKKSNKTFTPTTDLTEANAIRVTLKCVQDRNSAVPLTFMALLGRSSANVSATSIAAVDFSAVAGGAGNGRFEYYIPATSNPWLAGMPDGSVANPNNPHNNPDYAGTAFVDSGAKKVTTNNGNSGHGSSTDSGSNEENWSNWGDYADKKSSPITAGGVTVSPGVAISFDGVNGGANNMNANSYYDADGNTTWITGNLPGAENGIGDIRVPGNSVIGVFLDNTAPSSNASIPSTLDFSTAASRDFQTLQPRLRQPFFIGDGRTSTGEVQQFIPPTGATRLYIGTMDSYEWNNNVGGFNVTAHASGKIVTVR